MIEMSIKTKSTRSGLRNHQHLLQYQVLETDCPWLCPTGLPSSEFNHTIGIFLTSKSLENVLRAHGKNVSAIIQIANSNAIRFCGLRL
jgi:hypothetical protein